MLTITDKGVNTIEQWGKTYEGAKIIQNLENKLKEYV